MIYFAGHGLELGGVNYLVPIDAKLSSDRDASFEAVELQKVLDAVGGAKKIGSSFSMPAATTRSSRP